MHLLSFLAVAAQPGGTAVNEMLRLIGIATIVYAFFKGIKSLLPLPASPASPATPATARPAPTAAPALDLSPEIIAVIAAAVASVTGSSRRIVSIKSQSSHWERAGRQSVLTSHRIR